MSKIELDRRALIGSATAGLAMAAMGGASSANAATVAKGDAGDVDNFRAYMLMRGAYDDRVVIGYISGAYYGVVGSQITPLWDVVAATFARYTKRADGGFDAVTSELAYFVDRATGEQVKDFTNPYTGGKITDPGTHMPPSHIIIAPGPKLLAPNLPPSVKLNHNIKPAQIRGDDIWIMEESMSDIPLPNGTMFRYSEFNTLHGKVSDMRKPGVKRVPCATSFTNVVDWRPWMNMAGHPGHMTAVGNGRYGVPIDLLPAKWIELTRQQHPKVLTDPGSILEKAK